MRIFSTLTPTVWKFTALSMLVAGTFGALHDQISYTVSPEFFTRFKFIQFGLTDADVPERLRAATVGFLATWWMGVPIGLITGVASRRHPTEAQRRRALLWSLPLMMAVTLAFALAGLALGFSMTSPNAKAYETWWMYLPPNLQDPQNYICAGLMHDAAHLGGAISIPIAWAFHALYRRRWAKKLT